LSVLNLKSMYVVALFLATFLAGRIIIVHSRLQNLSFTKFVNYIFMYINIQLAAVDSLIHHYDRSIFVARFFNETE